MVVGRSRVTLLPFPRDDEVFVRRAELLKDAVDGDADAPQRLQALLRRDYPDAIVRPRDGFAAVDEASEAWYVYRDGGAARKVDNEERIKVEELPAAARYQDAAGREEPDSDH